MMNKTPFDVVKSRYVTEKSTVLEQLQNATSNKCVSRCESPKFVFLVDKKANKREISKAIETIYKEKKVKVKSVNTITVKPKKRRVRGRVGYKPGYKKAIVTFEKGDSIDEAV